MSSTRACGHAAIDPEKCTSCQMCATFCPTGAIRKWKAEDGTFGVEHYPGDCVKCRCCEDICRTNALWLSDEVFAVDLLSGAVDRYEMAPLKNPPNDPDSILHSMKDLIGISQDLRSVNNNRALCEGPFFVRGLSRLRAFWPYFALLLICASYL